MPNVAALIFDCDGTLTDSMPLHFLAWRQTLDRHELVLDEDRFYSLGGMPSSKIIEMLCREQGRVLDVAAATHEKEQAFFDLLHELEPIATVLDIARQQRGQLKMAVASGGLRHVIQRQLTLIGCLDWFDALVTAEDTQLHKPEPDVFLEAARRLGVAPAQCRVYEDADLGIEAARRAGMECVDVRDFHTPRRITART